MFPHHVVRNSGQTFFPGSHIHIHYFILADSSWIYASTYTYSYWLCYIPPGRCTCHWSLEGRHCLGLCYMMFYSSLSSLALGPHTPTSLHRFATASGVPCFSCIILVSKPLLAGALIMVRWEMYMLLLLSRISA